MPSISEATPRPLNNLHLGQVLDDVGSIKETAPREVGTAERPPALGDVVVARQAALPYAAESAAACRGSRSAPLHTAGDVKRD